MFLLNRPCVLELLQLAMAPKSYPVEIIAGGVFTDQMPFLSPNQQLQSIGENFPCVNNMHTVFILYLSPFQIWWCKQAWVSEQFLNGTSAHIRLFSALQWRECHVSRHVWKKTLRVWIGFCIWIRFDLISGSGLPQNLIRLCLLSAVFSVQNFTKSYSQRLHIPVDRQTASTVDGIMPVITVYAVITIRLLLLLHPFNRLFPGQPG